MGTEAAWIPAVIAAVGAGASAYNTRQTARRQDNALAEQIRAQAQRQREASARVQQTVQNVEGSNPDADRAQAMQQYLAQIQRAQSGAEGALDTAGAVSDRYSKDSAAAGQSILSGAQTTADIMSRIDAPFMQRQREGIDFSRMGSDISLVQRGSDMDQYLGDLRMRGIRRNPWIDAFSQAAQAYGSSAAGGGGGMMGAGTSVAGWNGQPLPGATTPVRGWGSI